jgi:hypothetical protein
MLFPSVIMTRERNDREYVVTLQKLLIAILLNKETGLNRTSEMEELVYSFDCRECRLPIRRRRCTDL